MSTKQKVKESKKKDEVEETNKRDLSPFASKKGIVLGKPTPVDLLKKTHNLKTKVEKK